MSLASRREPLLPGGQTSVGVATSTEIVLQEFGSSVRLKESCYKRTNHFIAQSRPYFANRWLFKYWYVERLRWLIAFCFLANFLSPFSLYMAIGMDGLNFLFLLIFFQHLFVHCHTMKYVRMQPVIPQEKSLNTFYKLTVRELTGVYLEAYQQGHGFLNMASGEIKFQVFNPRAIEYMDRTRRISYYFLLLIMIMCAVSGVSTWYNWGKWQMSEQFTVFR